MADAPVTIDIESMPIDIQWIDARDYTSYLAIKYMNVNPIGGRITNVVWRNLPFSTNAIYFIQKSTAVTSGWKTLARLSMQDSSYLDTNANNTMNRHESEFYRLVSVTDKSVVEVSVSDGYIDPYGAEIAKRHRIQLINGRAGNRTFVFTRMHNSTRCPDCWDEILQHRSKVNCVTCNSTGFISGYYNPIEAYISFGPESVEISQKLDGPSTSPNAVQCWTGNYPIISVGDIVIEPGSNRIWSVRSRNFTMYKRIITKQDIILQREDGDDPLYELIKRLPDNTKGGDSDGKSIFQNDAENSAGVRYSGTTTLLC